MKRAAPPGGAVARDNVCDVTTAVHTSVAGVDAATSEYKASVVGGLDEQHLVVMTTFGGKHFPLAELVLVSDH